MTSTPQPVAPSAGSEKRGLLLIGHGTRDAEGTAEFLAVADQLTHRLAGWVVQPCFLEFAEPDISAGLAALVRQGVSHLTAMPLLLLAAGHAKRDIPQWLARAAAEFPGLSWRLTAHLGCHPDVLELSAQRFAEAQAAVEPMVTSQTLLLFIGRGSTDPEANAQLAQFCRLRWEQTPTGWYEIGFTALAEPSLERCLELAAFLPFPRVVVQPHLLFSGTLLDRVRAAVAQQRSKAPGKEWLVTAALGPAPKLVEAVRQIVAET